MDDLDAVEPAGKIWDHWIVWNIPPEQQPIPEGWDPETAGARAGTNDFGERGYGGPSPSDREHTYRFRLFALETELGTDLDTEATAADLESAMDGHVLATATIEGTRGRIQPDRDPDPTRRSAPARRTRVRALPAAAVRARSPTERRESRARLRPRGGRARVRRRSDGVG
ncbi:phosphatidylethanolamine-binding protein [Natrialba magadii ATCC 43099]|uniref:Phosphatidylethanolamine-binding protein n=1 Tax=Natrialba magadii (strain ATCC 43099 / DSM 3394 / CCM 3739 / CIP 104546 / IAM 13178 / JCM 8861 / NBRC 102185 / NCIMB 2190 / MS3) TaxID=547559 RepID=L9V9E7_NATMM|nr:phosphatidylethanolamine-binding protein [Natrialba magadii ATCC 43099]